MEFGLPVFQSQKGKQVESISNAEYHTAAKGESWKFRLMNTIDECMRYAKSRNEFIALILSEGYDVRWTDSRKNITYTTPDSLKCREDNRRFINGVFWILRTGAPWRDLPPDYGDWKNTHRRFCRWRDKGIWEKLLESFSEEPELKWLMIDASHIKVHPHGTGARGGNQEMGRTKGGSTRSCILPWMRMVSRSGFNSPLGQ